MSDTTFKEWREERDLTEAEVEEMIALLKIRDDKKFGVEV